MQDKNKYAIIANEYSNLLTKMVVEASVFVLDKELSVEEFKVKVEDLVRHSTYLDTILFDITILRNDVDFTEAIKYLRISCFDNIRIIVIAPKLRNPSQMQKLVQLSVYDILTLDDKQVNLNNKQEVENEIEYWLDYLDRNPKSIADVVDYLDMEISNETESEEVLIKQKKFGIKNKEKKQRANRKEKTKKSKNINSDAPYKFQFICRDDRYKEKLIDDVSGIQTVRVFEDEARNKNANILVFEGNYDEFEIDGYDIKNAKVFIINNQILDDDYEQLKFVDYEFEDNILQLLIPYIQDIEINSNKSFKPKKQKAKSTVPISKILGVLMLVVIGIIGYIAYPLLFSKTPNEKYSIEYISDSKDISYKGEHDLEELVKTNCDSCELIYEIDGKTNKPGEITVNYSLMSGEEIVSNLEVVLNVIDDIAPVLTLNEKETSLDNHEMFNCLSFVKDANDEIDGELFTEVECDNQLDATKHKQEVKFSLADKSNNVSEAILTVILTSVPEPSIEPDPSSNPSLEPSNKPEITPTSTPTTTPEVIEIEMTVDEIVLKYGDGEARIQEIVGQAVKARGNGYTQVSIDYSEVNTGVVGTYKVYYKATDEVGKTKEMTAIAKVIK